MLAVAVAVGPVFHAAAEMARVLYPPDKSVVGTNFVVVVALVPSAETQSPLKLDGQPLAAERLSFTPEWMGKPLRFQSTNAPHSLIEVNPKTHALWLAVATFDPGLHVIEAGGSRVEFYRNIFPHLVNAPAGFQYFNKHLRRKPQSEAIACANCHDLQQAAGGRVIGLPRVPDRCADCHENAEMPDLHRHIMSPLARCQQCHDPHGSVRAMLLVDTQEKLCTRCHDLNRPKQVN